MVQDRHRSHWTQKVRKWFADKDVDLLDWPVNAPEINAIEACWGRIKQIVQDRAPVDQHSLELAVQYAIRYLDQSYVKKQIFHSKHLMQGEADKGQH